MDIRNHLTKSKGLYEGGLMGLSFFLWIGLVQGEWIGGIIAGLACFFVGALFYIFVDRYHQRKNNADN
jgi:hypothetical protein